MPSPVHAVIVELLEVHPEALSYLLGLPAGHASGRRAQPGARRATPRRALPAPLLVPAPGTKTRVIAIERRVDRVFVLGSRAAPKGFVLAEVQLAPDEDKLYAWSLYVELGRTRYRCEGALVVLTVSASVRRWIARWIDRPTGILGSERRLSPRVIALDAIDPALLLVPAKPHLAVLAVAGHADAPDLRAIAEEAITITMDRVPDRLAQDRLDAILGMVPERLRPHLERFVMEHPRYKSETFRRWHAEAVAEGESKGRAKAILDVLATRGIEVSEGVRAEILGCTDEATLSRWLQRAVVESTADSVVRPPKRARTGSRQPARAGATRR